MQKQFSYITKLLILFLSLAVVSCDSENDSVVKNDIRIESRQINPEDYPLEDLSDASFYESPRIQFMWGIKGITVDHLFSMKLDGSDIRRVIEPKKILYDGATTYLHTPVRSPNRRFLAYANSGKGFSDRNIIDLKTGEITKLTRGGTVPSFSWSPDNNYLFFFTDFELYRYHLPGKTLVKLNNTVPAAGIFAVPDNKTLIGVIKEGLAYYDYEGKEINRFDLGLADYSKVNFDVSRNGKYFLFRNSNPELLYRLDKTPKLIKRIKKNKDFSGESIFIGDLQSVNRSYFGMTIFDLKNNESIDLLDSGENILSNYSFMN